MTDKTNHKEPPTNARRIWRVADLPPDRGDWWYEITNGSQPPQRFQLAKRRRQVIDLLMQGPVYCASPVRISDVVFLLKRELGLDVHTEHYPGDDHTGAGTYGIYFLRSRVRRLSSVKEAA